MRGDRETGTYYWVIIGERGNRTHTSRNFRTKPQAITYIKKVFGKTRSAKFKSIHHANLWYTKNIATDVRVGQYNNINGWSFKED